MTADEVRDIIKKGNFIHFAINSDEKHFRASFSKMEYIMAYEYLNELNKKLSISSFSIIVPENIYRGNDRTFSKFINGRKQLFRDQPLTEMEKIFMNQFKDFMDPHKPEFTSARMSLWERFLESEHSVKVATKNILITGFDTDNEIFINALNAADMGFVPIVLSDCVSGPSERNHFNALEFMSRFTYIIDSRDLMSIMGDV
ncbi:MAG: isochorismatase family protein [Cuniculiplasma sp.]